jgi:hypothetical protein
MGLGHGALLEFAIMSMLPNLVNIQERIGNSNMQIHAYSCIFHPFSDLYLHCTYL